MPVTRLHDKHEIAEFLRQDVHLHIYSLGDLDAFFWLYATFYGLTTTGRLAALGNIATHPAYRGRGFGKAVTARTCQSLSQAVSEIGLNVKADNFAAIACHERLGFETVAEYGEFRVHRK